MIDNRFVCDSNVWILNYITFRTDYTPGIYAEGYIVFVFPFVRSYVRSFVCSFVRSFVRSYFLPSRGICVKVLR